MQQFFRIPILGLLLSTVITTAEPHWGRDDFEDASASAPACRFRALFVAICAWERIDRDRDRAYDKGI
ncbi:MAG: hypothetical protein HN742_40165 [Lentisphaerae bacterium]|nr:hypothetical protein [Lentisphaerota bacterium]MBT5607386.1 hypothetical protein [Lentisphaerota bacterium]MBT7057818.1 hypothetical protein [Lentisphaerota bacterium]MBT7848151.1 hypothetical protein [Lentisphaerota bacterium]